MERSATEMVIWSAEARAELFCRFFIFVVLLAAKGGGLG